MVMKDGMSKGVKGQALQDTDKHTQSSVYKCYNLCFKERGNIYSYVSICAVRKLKVTIKKLIRGRNWFGGVGSHRRSKDGKKDLYL